MNILKNFEAVFVVALGVAACAGYLAPSSAESTSAPTLNASVATPTRMAVVTVPGKRMSAIEKQRSLEDERRIAKSAGAGADRS